MIARARAAVRHRAARLPLPWRLTLVSASVLALILVAFGATLYGDVERAIGDSTATGLRLSARPAIGQYLRATGRPAATPAAGGDGPAPGGAAAAPEPGTTKALTDLARALTTRNIAARTTDVDGVTQGDGPALMSMTTVSAPAFGAAVYRGVARTLGVRHWRLETANGPLLIELIPLVPPGGEPRQATGVLQLSASLRDGDELLARLRTLLLGGTLLAIAATILLTFPLVRGILAPLRRMAAASRAITAGDLSRRVAVPAGRDALADLAVAFNEMVGKLDAALAAQRRFVADASHELRTPLTALGNGVEMLRLGVDRRDPAAREKLLRLMEGEIARMGRLVDDLLTLSALDRDPAHALQLGPVDLAALAAQVVDETRLLAPDRTVALDAPPGAPVVVRGDADRLRQALLNLCANARAHTPPGGAITVGVRRGGGGARVTVADTGAGIALEDLGRVWDRFYRADPARERRAGAGGVGLGLAIVRAIVEAHGGGVALASAVGEGTTVTLTLPAAPSADRAPPAPAAAPAPPPDGGGAARAPRAEEARR